MTTENSSTDLVTTSKSLTLARVSNQLTLTNKLLAKSEEPFLIPYRKGNKWGFCDRNKNIVIDCIYSRLKRCGKSLTFWVGSSSKGSYLIDSKKLHIYGPYFDISTTSTNGPWCANKLDYNESACFDLYYEGVLNIDGIYYPSPLGELSPNNEDNLFRTYIEDKCELLEFNDGFNILTKGYFTHIRDFYCGMACFTIIEENVERCGFINLHGDVVIQPEYDIELGLSTNYEFCYDLCVVYKNGKYGVINTNNKIILPLKFYNIKLHNNTIFVFDDDDILSYKCYDKLGKYLCSTNSHENSELLVPSFFDVPLFCNQGVIYYIEGYFINDGMKKFGIMDENYNMIIPSKYDFIYLISNKVIVVEMGSTWSIINMNNKLLTEKTFSATDDTSFGFRVKYCNRWALIDLEGNLFIYDDYDILSKIGKDILSVKGGGQYLGYMSSDGIKYWED